MCIRASRKSLCVIITASLLSLPCDLTRAQGIPASQPASLSVRVQVPSAAAQAAAQKTVRDTFGDIAQVAPDKRADLARQMLAESRDNGNDGASRYVLLKQTIELAARARDAAVAMDAVSEMATHFLVDGEQLKLDALRECFTPSMAPEQAAAVAKQCIALSQSAMKSDRYDVADRALVLAESAERIAQQPELMTLIATRRRDMNRQKSAAASAEAAERRLKNNPDDPEANFARGFYLTAVKEDWTTGLPLLAKGANVPFKTAAVRDLANPSKPDAMVAAGDGWWDLSQNETGAIQSSLRKRAGFWYSQLLSLQSFSGLGRTRLEKRMAQFASADEAKPDTEISQSAGPHLLFPRKRSVALFEAHKEEEPIFRAICGNSLDVINQSETESKLLDPLLWTNSGIIVFGANRLRDLPAAGVTPAFETNLRQFVGTGGDLIVFEQAPQDKAGRDHVELINELFGVKVKGGPFPGVQFAIRDLGQRAADVGYTPQSLGEIRFYNGYELPRGSMNLLRDAKGRIVTAGVAPFGRGHLILIGTGLETADLKLDGMLFEFLYGGVPQEATK